MVKKNTSDVSVAIVSFNNRTPVLTLLRRLESLDIPVFLTENGSSDGTIEAIRGKFSNLTILESRHNLGGTGGFNCAVLAALSTGSKYIILLDDDVLPDMECIDSLACFLDTHDDYVFAAPAIYITSKPDTLQETGGGVDFSSRMPVQAWNRFSVNPDLPDLLDIDYASACCFMVRSRAVKQLGVMDWNYFIFSDDVDWSLRLRGKFGKGACVTTARATHDFPWSKPFSPMRLYYFHRNGLYMLSRLRQGKSNYICLFFAVFRIIRDMCHSLVMGDFEIFNTLKSVLTDSILHRFGKWEKTIRFGQDRKVLTKGWFKKNRIQSLLIDITMEDFTRDILDILGTMADGKLRVDILCDDHRTSVFREKMCFSKVYGRKSGILGGLKTFLRVKKQGYDLIITDAAMFPRRPTAMAGGKSTFFHSGVLYSAVCRPISACIFSVVSPIVALALTPVLMGRFLRGPGMGKPSEQARLILEQLGYDPFIGQPWARLESIDDDENHS